jgi:putative DNA primase/helicase
LYCREVDGRVLLWCHACNADFKDIVNGLGISNGRAPEQRNSGWDIVAAYDYEDADGNFVYQKVRLQPKDFRLRRRGDDGEWVWKMGDTERVLYRLPNVVEAAAMGRWVFVCEGEKDVARLEHEGLTATTAPDSSRWRRQYTEALQGAHVAVLPDNDDQGRKHATRAARALADAGIDVRVVELPNLPPKGDVTDWLATGASVSDLWDLVQNAEAWGPQQERDETKTAKRPDDPFTELAAAYRLKDIAGDDLWHTDGLGWLAWDGCIWRRSRKAAERAVHLIGETYRREAAQCTEIKEAAPYFKWAKHCEARSGSLNILGHAAALDGIDGDAEEWDAERWLLTCPNGTLDLRTGALLPFERRHKLTRMCATKYQSGADAPRWRLFLEEVFAGDYEVIDYLRWALGYALSGSTKHDVFFVLFGGGCNGKSTLIDAFMDMLGVDLAHQIDPEQLMIQRNAQHTTELASLVGTRFLAATETNDGRRLNEPLIKTLTGGDRIRARFMRQDSFEFTPQCKLFLATNHRPQIRDDSGGMWRRVRLIPFEVSFLGREDKDLEDALREEAPGILNWALEGAMIAADEEPPVPDRVKVATDEYKHNEDTLAVFLEEECDVYANAIVAKGVLYRAYKEWMGGRAETQKRFNERLRERGFEETRGHGGQRQWRGVSLVNSEASNDGVW